ncbi:MAG: branched-chain amino acid aminotransferase [Deferribacteraceae bacterium]|jgi:branched-chain amino acid aminotransferase|nr:branched-chain amino acid aminotransferase [Deferribacteraceae bacterium]
MKISKTTTAKEKPADPAKYPWGSVFSDHMFIIDYKDGQGWHDPRIVPYGPISISPAAKCFHYGQELFEGMKAYNTADGGVAMFRPIENMKRINNSCVRMCMPQINEEEMVSAIAELVRLDKSWIPTATGTSLYIRPFMIATEAAVAAHPSHEYMFIVIMSPVAAYYPNGLAPVRIYVEHKDVRAVRGGTGEAKCGGNYAASMRAQAEAEKKGYAQVLWLDGVEQKYIEEVGAMNVWFVIDGKAITPALNGSILPGITRKSVAQVLKDWNIHVEERKISIEEVAAAYKAGKLQEVFGTGTAAVISPVGELKYDELVMNINDGKIGSISQRLYDEITGIQSGKVADRHGWVYRV